MLDYFSPNRSEQLIQIFFLCREEVARELKSALSSIKLSERGVYVQASTLGSLEALLEFLRTSNIPVSVFVCAIKILAISKRISFEFGNINEGLKYPQEFPLYKFTQQAWKRSGD